ncbi:hypothetical protein [Rhizobium sullae]|uniref:Uncharacterized protein n=1 Tax=Rhizobium sullae TaxID=50338 RepID=A0ABY5XP93_RHISU|nr:hypothetical protein [Rhizobium sullae]UWU15762.1 hypothetical protein N2599_07135 [Rhizobium sullae]
MSNSARTGGTEAFNGISRTRFGKSVESRAQIDDAARQASFTPDDGEALNVYRVVPVAAADDLNWQNSPSQGEVVVAARTAGDARIVAASRELDFMEIDSAPADDVTTINASAFRNDKLYTVIEIEHGRRDLRRGVLEGDIAVNNIRPTQG